MQTQIHADDFVLTEGLRNHIAKGPMNSNE